MISSLEIFISGKVERKAMNAAFYIKLYLASLAAFLVIDMIWLGGVARSFYRQQLGVLMSPAVNWAAAIVFYLLFIAGLLVFVVLPGLRSGSLGQALLAGAFFGLVTYATYDLTNLATLRNWPWVMTVVDLLWGAVLSSAVSGISFLVGRWMLS
jgi:uncharacterized membrane protein